MRRTLYSAADDPFMGDVTSFARRRADAEAYRDSPGYGGATLYRVVVDIDEDAVLDTRDDMPRWLARAVEAMGAVNVEEAIPMSSKIQSEARARGFRWVIVEDSFPEGAETWLLITAPDADDYGDDVADAMEPV